MPEIAEQHEEAEGELLHEQRQHHAGVVVGEPQRLADEARSDEQLVEPAAGAVEALDADGEQDHAERDRQDEDRRDRPLHADAAAHAVGQEQRRRDDDDRGRNGKREGDPDGAVLPLVAEEGDVVGEAEADGFFAWA
jgi:hypothetical protein